MEWRRTVAPATPGPRLSGGAPGTLPVPDTVRVPPGGGAQFQLGIEPLGLRPGHQGEQLGPQARRRPPRPGPVRAARSAGTPARWARRCSWAARARAGWPNGTPSSADPREPVADSRSAALISSQLRVTSSAPDTATPANTCGCRRTSLVTMASATSSTVKPVPSARSSAMRAWNITCSSTSPSSPRSAARSPLSSASSASYASSMRYGASDSWVCSASQGHRRRSVSITATSVSSSPPGSAVEPYSSSTGGIPRPVRPAQLVGERDRARRRVRRAPGRLRRAQPHDVTRGAGHRRGEQPGQPGAPRPPGQHLPADPGLLQGGQQRVVPGRGQHPARAAQQLPGRPAEQPRADRGRGDQQDEPGHQQCGVSCGEEVADGAGDAVPGAAASLSGAGTMAIWL